jgi:hypothetical protein
MPPPPRSGCRHLYRPVTHGAPRATLSWEVRAKTTGTRGTPRATLHREAGAGAQATRGTPVAALSREVGAGATRTHGAHRAALHQEAGAGAQATRGAPRAALSREVGAGATGTCGTPGAVLSQEVGAGATGTRGTPRAALRREQCWSPGDTWWPQSCPEPGGGYHSTAPSSAPFHGRSGCGAVLIRPPLLLPGRHPTRVAPPLHDFDDHDHLDIGYLGIKGLSSVCGTCRFLLQSQYLRHHDAATAGMSVRQILPSTYSPVSPSVVLPL